MIFRQGILNHFSNLYLKSGFLVMKTGFPGNWIESNQFFLSSIKFNNKNIMRPGKGIR